MSLGSNKQLWIQGNAAVSSNTWVQFQSTLANTRTFLAGVDTNNNVNVFALTSANAKVLAVANVTYNSLPTGNFRVFSPTVVMDGRQIMSDFAGNTWIAGYETSNSSVITGNIWVGKFNPNISTAYWQNSFKIASAGTYSYSPLLSPKWNGNGAIVYGTLRYGAQTNDVVISYNNNGTLAWSTIPYYQNNDTPTDVTVDSTGNVWLSSYGGASALLKLNSSGTLQFGNTVTQTVGGTTKTATVWNLATSSTGNAYVAVYSANWPGATNRMTTVAQMSANTSVPVTVWSTNLWNMGPSKISPDKSGNIYVATYDATSTISYLVKLNGTTGSVLWAKQISATDNFANVSAVMTISPLYSLTNNNVVTTCQINGQAQSIVFSLNPDGYDPPTNVAFSGNGVVVSISNVSVTSNSGTLTWSSAGASLSIITPTPTLPSASYGFSGTIPYYVNNSYFPGIATPTPPPTPPTITYLAIGGGASGGAGQTSGGGGGGAGGFVSNSFTATTGTVYTITVGQGGAAQLAGGSAGYRGANGQPTSITAVSSFSNVLAYGGGGGGAITASVSSGTDPNGFGFAGGSGGGAGNYNGEGQPGQTFDANAQGNWGGDAINNGPVPNYPSAGGGGAGGRGLTAANAYVGGLGGPGLYSTITGANVAYAGGGGGAAYYATNPIYFAQGGVGGGGIGGVGTAAGQATGGADGKGGGGGGQNQDNSKYSGKGGNGAVILSISTSNYTGTYTGSNVVVTTSGSNTILTFNANGTYTA
jgi:hypothetical protein